MTEAAAPPPCPIPLTAIPPNFQKHVDPSAPAMLRMMGAKGLVPLGPTDMATALCMLTFDPDAAVRETAAKSATGLPDRILSVALRAEDIDPHVLDCFADLLAEKPEYQEMLLLNNNTSDETVAKIAARGNEKLLEVVGQNQLRILRHEPIVRALINNPATRPSTLDNVTDFCVRSGLMLEDVPAFQAARRRVLGGAAVDEAKLSEETARARAEEAAAEAELTRMGLDQDVPVADDEAPERVTAAVVRSEGLETVEQEKRRLSITQQVMKLTVAKKIEWANKKGNREVRTLLLRDPNKLVQLAVVQSPRITENELQRLSLSRTISDDVIRYIYSSRQIMRSYQMKVNVANNPKVPAAVSMRLLTLLRASELKTIAKNRNISSAVQIAAAKILEKKKD